MVLELLSSSFKGKYVLVTGATNGIRSSIALLYRKLGAKVFINGRNKGGIQKWIDSHPFTSSDDPTGVFLPATGDVSTEEGVASVVVAVDEIIGVDQPLDVISASLTLGSGQQCRHIRL
jgi:NAD(P)-dependent dehydrogenase (short-subunit alcohol dehydrogenase family)